MSRRRLAVNLHIRWPQRFCPILLSLSFLSLSHSLLLSHLYNHAAYENGPQKPSRTWLKLHLYQPETLCWHCPIVCSFLRTYNLVLTLSFDHIAKPSLWIIELHNGQDNRLTHELINKAVMPALDIVEREWRAQRRTALETKNTEGGKGALIIVGRRDQDKFFSNGMR